MFMHAAIRAVYRAEDRMRAAFGTSLRDDPAQRSCVLVFAPSSCPERVT
jgi:hypothetical protein